MSAFKSRIAAVVASTAILAVAGTTGAVAAKMIDGGDIKNGTVTTKDIKNDSLKGKDIKNGSIGFGDISERGKTKLAGKDGADGQDGHVGNILHNSHTVMVPAHSNGDVVSVTCAEGDYGDAKNGAAEGYVATGGGFNTKNRSGDVIITQSRQMVSLNGDYSVNGKGWIVTVNNTTDAEQQVQAWVVCISAPNDNPDD